MKMKNSWLSKQVRNLAFGLTLYSNGLKNSEERGQRLMSLALVKSRQKYGHQRQSHRIYVFSRLLLTGEYYIFGYLNLLIWLSNLPYYIIFHISEMLLTVGLKTSKLQDIEFQ